MKIPKKWILMLWLLVVFMVPLIPTYPREKSSSGATAEPFTSNVITILVAEDVQPDPTFIRILRGGIETNGYRLSLLTEAEMIAGSEVTPLLRLAFDQDGNAVELELLVHPLRELSPIVVDLPEPVELTGSITLRAMVTTIYALYAAKDCDAAQTVAAFLPSQTGADETVDRAFDPTHYVPAFQALVELNCVWLEGANTAMLMNQDVFRASSDLDIAATSNFAWSILQIGNQDMAFRKLDALAERWSDDLFATVEIMRKQSQFYALINDFDSAMDVIERAIDLATGAFSKPDLAPLYIQRGQVRVLLYEWDTAVSDYTTAIQFAPDTEAVADAYYYRGIVYYTTLLDRELALPDFERYLALAPYGEHRDDAAQYLADIKAELEALSD